MDGPDAVDDLEILLFINSHSEYVFDDISNRGYAELDLELSVGSHVLHGMPYYDPLIIELVQEFGLEDFEYCKGGIQKMLTGSIGLIRIFRTLDVFLFPMKRVSLRNSLSHDQIANACFGGYHDPLDFGGDASGCGFSSAISNSSMFFLNSSTRDSGNTKG